MLMAQQLLLMAANNHSDRGFTLIELLVYISLYILMTAFLLPCMEGIMEVDSRLELEGFCQRLAAEVTDLQQASLWGNSLQNKLTLDLNQQCYYVYNDGELVKKVKLQEIGQGKLYFYSPSTSIIRFSAEGAPQTYFSVLIKNRQQPQLAKKFEVQPVTGRIVISDSK